MSTTRQRVVATDATGARAHSSNRLRYAPGGDGAGLFSTIRHAAPPDAEADGLDHAAKCLAGLDDVLGLRIRLAHSAVQRHFVEHYADIGLTPKQISVLWLVDARPGVAQTDIAHALHMDRATTMTLVHGLERRGLLQRAPAARDARKVAFGLTETGSVALETARKAVARHERWLQSRFSKEEVTTLKALLRRIHG